MKKCKICGSCSSAVAWSNKKPTGEPVGLVCQPCKNKQNRDIRLTPEGRKSSIQAGVRAEMKRRQASPLHAAIARIRCTIYHAIKASGYGKSTTSFKLLGCTKEELFIHLGCENGIPDGYEIDHIIPMAIAFDEESAKLLQHYKNLRLETAEANKLKADRLVLTNGKIVRARDLTLEQRKCVIELFKLSAR